MMPGMRSASAWSWLAAGVLILATGSAAADAPPGPATASPKGSLDKEVIRRVIRGHINEVKACYERRLTEKPALQGKVIVAFVVAASGDVSDSKIDSSTMD